jgi:E3 ubiquitin-protein ligase MUL1
MAAHDYELCMVFARMAMAGDGVVLGLGMTFLAIRTWLKFRSHSKALKEVGETAVFGVSDLRTFLDCTENEVMVRTEVLEKVRDCQCSCFLRLLASSKT